MKRLVTCFILTVSLFLVAVPVSANHQPGHTTTPPATQPSAQQPSSEPPAECALYGRTFPGCEGTRSPGEWLYDNTVGAVLGVLGDLSLRGLWWTMALFAYLFFIIAEFLMWLGTTLFDNVLYFLVTNMGTFIQHEQAGGIRLAWAAIRDLMNIAIIGGFIAVGFSTILQVQQYNASRFLARLIIAALLVNFSYFFAGAIIDSSNYIAVQAQRSQIMTEGCVKIEDSKELGYLVNWASGATTWAVGTGDLCSISGTFTKIVNLGTWDKLKEQVGSHAEGSASVNKAMFFIGMIGGFMYVMVGFIFFSGAVLLIARFVALILLLVASPVGVAGSNIPFIDGFAKKWWSALFSHAFFAPIFIILVAIGLRVLADSKKIFVSEVAGQGAYAGIASGNFETAIQMIPMFISFGIGIGFMYAALQVARSMTQSGKEFVGGIYDGVQKKIGGFYGNVYQATAGGLMKLPSMAYDATVGQAARIPVLGGFVGRITNPIGRALREDPSAKPFGADLSNADAAKAAQEYAKSLESFGGLVNVVRHPIESVKNLGYAARDAWDNFVEKFFGVGSLADLMKRAANGEKLEGAARRKLERHIQGMKDEDIDKMSADELQKLAPYMSVKQYKRIMERSDLNEVQRGKIQEARWKEIDEAKERGDHQEVARLLRNMDKTERKLLMVEYGEYRTDKQVLAALDAKTYDELINDNDIYGDGDYKDIKEHRAREVANTPGRISETDAKHIKNNDVADDTIKTMTPAQARRLYKNTKDQTLRSRLAARFPDLEGPGPAQADEDEDEEKRKNEQKKKEEEKKKKEEDEKKGKAQNSSDNPRLNTPYK